MKKCLIRFPVEHSLYQLFLPRNFRMIKQDVVRLEAMLESFEKLPDIFVFFRYVLKQSEILLRAAYGNRKQHCLELELFRIVYFQLLRHLRWVDNDDLGTIHEMWPKPNWLLYSTDADISFIIKNLGDQLDMWINRFIAEVVKAAERQMSHTE